MVCEIVSQLAHAVVPVLFLHIWLALLEYADTPGKNALSIHKVNYCSSYEGNTYECFEVAVGLRQDKT